MTLRAGACLNPWFGLAQTMLWLGYAAEKGMSTSSSADCLWVYMLGPLFGAVAAGLFTIFHHKIESLGIEMPLSESIAIYRDDGSSQYTNF